MTTPTKKAKNRWKLETRLITRAVTNNKFKQRLLRDPKAILSKRIGTELPDNITVTVYEETAVQAYLVVPHAGHEQLGSLKPPNMEKSNKKINLTRKAIEANLMHELLEAGGADPAWQPANSGSLPAKLSLQAFQENKESVVSQLVQDPTATFLAATRIPAAKMEAGFKVDLLREDANTIYIVIPHVGKRQYKAIAKTDDA